MPDERGAQASDRLSQLDAAFLRMEDGGAHMHIGSVLLFAGGAPPYAAFVEHMERRLHLVPRYRQRLAFVPLGQARPKWVDDPSFNLGYHVRHTALPSPGSEEQLRSLAGRVLSQRLDRDKPLWELWLVDGLEGDRFAVVVKAHHALADGISVIDVATVLFDTEPNPVAPPSAGERWTGRPPPTRAQLLGEALAEGAGRPAQIARSLLGVPRGVLDRARGALRAGGARSAPSSPYNTGIGPHRRVTWVRMSLADVRAVKDELGGTVNDVMLAVVAGALRRHLGRRGHRTEGLELQAMVPMNVRTEAERGRLGNRIVGLVAPLPVWSDDPIRRLSVVSAAMAELKRREQEWVDEPSFNLLVTSVPGPQLPLYLLGRELIEPFGIAALDRGRALAVAIVSYNGRMTAGLVGDYDVLADLDDLAGDVAASLAELATAAGVEVERAAYW